MVAAAGERRCDRDRRSLAILRKGAGARPSCCGSSLNNLAGLFWAHGRYPEGEPLYRRSLAAREKALGPSTLMCALRISEEGGD
ncbi:MAG: tetratricopeptide repeat protein [Hyphomicrobiaceae bacterium]|nr:tetratricopeptide repeat protein [Hyphomicrobiaceae bacterium]